jgi:predicted RNA-binding Zn ribbon-like protein
MKTAENPFAALARVGGRLCLDFVNTVGWRTGEERYDHLHRYTELVWWGLHAGVLEPPVAEVLLDRAEAEPERAARVFERALEVREAMYRIFAAVAAGEEVEIADLGILNRQLSDAMAKAELVPFDGGFAWGWEEAAELERPVWPIVRSAAELLTSPELARVGECAGARCGWLYLDTSKNRSRRWCDMRDCGNRAKARRHYRRVRKGEQGVEE